MELIIKVNVKQLDGKDGKFNVFNTYIKDENTNEWVKFNVKFKNGVEKPVCNSYVYADENEVSINELGNYPTLFINKINKIVKLRFDGADLKKFFKTSQDDNENNDNIDVFDNSPIEGEELFDDDDGKK